MYFHWYFNNFSTLLKLYLQCISFIEISIEFQLVFQWISISISLKFQWYFIQISTGFLMVFHWYFIEISTGFPMAFH